LLKFQKSSFHNFVKSRQYRCIVIPEKAVIRCERRAKMLQKRVVYPSVIILKRVALATVVAVALCICAAAGASAQTPATVAPVEAKAILMRAAEFMAKTRSFSVDVRDSYDVYQESGQKIEFSEIRKITIARPDRLRVDVEESNGNKSVVLYDGKEITVSSPILKVYAKTPKRGTVDDAIGYFVRELGMKLPFSVLLQTTAPKELGERTQKLDYVEKTSVFGAPAYHLAGRSQGIDYQLWISDGDKPLLQRLVLTYCDEKGQPQFRAQFSNWNLAPETPASLFACVQPPGARQIAFLAQLPRSASKAGVKPVQAGTPEKSGGK
jgi:hypothetical protein